MMPSFSFSNPTWQPFDVFMQRALYHPEHGYYTRSYSQIGRGPANSDFATGPIISNYFGQTLAVQVEQCLAATGTDEIWEFGAGTGALALQLLLVLGDRVRSYYIVDLSGSLQVQQQMTLAAYPNLAAKVQWLDTLPQQLCGVVIGNEVLDAMPVKLLSRQNNSWFERGVIQDATTGAYAYSDQPTDLRPPQHLDGVHDYVCEIHPQAEAFVQTLAEHLLRAKRGGAVLLIDYGFTQSEYYHPSRTMGTIMCHQNHLSDADPLSDVGTKDITAHVNFSGIALAAQEAGLHINGYTSQGRFLLNCGLLDRLQNASSTEKAMAQKLITEHEMGELFKVICLSNLADFEPIGFSLGDRTHTL